MVMWEPWRGCRKFSEGCRFCYIHKGDARRKIKTSNIIRTAQFDKPLQKNKKGLYKVKSGQMMYVCFSSGFFLEEADSWRKKCWQMMKERQDLHFIFLTKRIHRFWQCVPEDWQEGYPNVTIGCTMENQRRVDERLPFFHQLPIKHKIIICQPLLERVTVEKYLSTIDRVVAGGESDRFARPLDYKWILFLREQSVRKNTSFEFRQCGSHFIKDGKMYHLQTRQLMKQASKANINFEAQKNA